MKRVGLASASGGIQMTLNQEGWLRCTCGSGFARWLTPEEVRARAPSVNGADKAASWCTHLLLLRLKGEVRWETEPSGIRYPVWAWANGETVRCIPDVLVSDPAVAMGTALKATLAYQSTGGFSDEDWGQLAALVLQRLHAEGFVIGDGRKEREARQAGDQDGFSTRRTRLIDLDEI